MADPTLFNQILVWPITNLLLVFYKPLSILRVPGALGFSIILLTAFVRLLLYPLNLKQLRSAKQMQELKPQIDKLSKRYKNNKKKLQEEQLKLYQKHGVNPAAGCLPTLLQFPVLIGLYRVFLQLLGNGNIAELTAEINKIVYLPALQIQQLNVDFLGINLALKPSSWQENGLWLLAVPALTAAFSYAQARSMQPPTPGGAKTQEHENTKTRKHESTKTKKRDEEDFASTMQSQMKYMFPLMIGWISFSFPLGLSLYWNTFAIFGIIQQLHVKRESEG